MKYTLLAGLLAITGVIGARNSFVMPEDGSEPVERLRRVPEGWNEIGAPSTDHKMRFRIAVRSVSRLDQNKLDISSMSASHSTRLELLQAV
jgi:tripeptidyl-peptidase-1